MAVISFSRQVSFPTAPLRETLQKQLPEYRWQCGEDDDGGARTMTPYRAHDIIVGRSQDEVIFTEIRSAAGPAADAPSGQWHLVIGPPTTDRRPVADRIVALVCSALMTPDEEGARCQLVTGGAWFAAPALPAIVQAVVAGEPLAYAVAGIAPAAPAPAPIAPPAPIAAASAVPEAEPFAMPSPSFPPPGFTRRPGGFGRKGL